MRVEPEVQQESYERKSPKRQLVSRQKKERVASNQPYSNDTSAILKQLFEIEQVARLVFIQGTTL